MDTITLLRQYRIGQFTIFDTVAAFVGMILLAPLLTKLCSKLRISIPRTAWIWLTIPIAVLVHLVFRQSTPLMRMLLDGNGFFLEKIGLVIMVFMGIRNIRILPKK